MAIEGSVLSGLEPAAFWQRFEELTTIARPSRHEAPVIAHVERWADSRGFERRPDAARNMVILAPACEVRAAGATAKRAAR